MLRAFARHPFGVEAFFRRSLVLTYAMPVNALADLVGPGLTLDTYDEKWGFLAIAMVQTEGLRPRGFPKWLGRDFFLSGYRIFTRLLRPGKPPLRGLKILRSDTDKRGMKILGNVFTHYNYETAQVTVTTRSGQLEIVLRTPAKAADLHVVADLSTKGDALPSESPFRTMQDARKFAGPLPYTFSFDPHLGKMVVVKGLRETWSPMPVHVDVRELTYLKSPRFVNTDARLANAFYLENVPYSWKPGTLEPIA